VGLKIARDNDWTAPDSSTGHGRGRVAGPGAPSSTNDDSDRSDHAESAAVEESSSSDESAAEKDEAR
jgi:hypothetical protein